MPSVDVVDETFIAVPPAIVAPEFARPHRSRLWPDLRLADPAGPDGEPAPAPPRRAAAEARRRQRAAKAIALACKDRLEAGRAPGEPPPPIGQGRPRNPTR